MAAFAPSLDAMDALPRERICIALDVGDEMSEPFDARRGGKSRAATAVPALRNWVTHKHRLSRDVEWCLVVLADAADVLLLPTRDREAVCATLELFAEQRSGDDRERTVAPFDFGSLFDALETCFEPASRPPGRVDRCVCVFGRARAPPLVPAAGRSPLLVDDAFFFDSLYIHAAPAPENRVQHVFDALLKVAGARAKASFSFETTSSTTKVQTFLFVLSSHPLLRGDSQTAVLAALDAAPDGDGGT